MIHSLKDRNLREEAGMHLVTLLTVVGIGVPGLSLLPEGNQRWSGVIILVCFYIFYFFSPSTRLEPPHIRSGYLLIQMLLAGGILVLSRAQSVVFAILFFILSSQIATIFDQRTGYRWIISICLEIAAIFFFFHGLNPILMDLLPFFAGIVFFGGFTYSWVEAREVKKEAAMLKRIEEIRLAALLDPLTNLGNRKFTQITLEKNLDTLSHEKIGIGILFIDIDRFKVVNDTYGHPVGDLVLKMVAGVLVSNVRSYDFVGRWGGEEIMIILVNVDLNETIQIAEDLRRGIEQASVSDKDQLIQVTVSIGATIARPEDDLSSLISRVDRLMYQSKQNGRNRVTAE